MDNIEDIYLLSPTQKGILFHGLSSPGAAEFYTVQMSAELCGRVDLAAFEQAWQFLFNRHPALRTAFLWEELDDPLQVVYRRVALPTTRHDWRCFSRAEQASKLQAFLKEDRDQGISPSEAPLARLALMTLAEDRHQFVLTFHFLLLDGWSRGLAFKEVLEVYEAFSRGQEPRLEPSQPYQHYIRWLQQQDFTESEAYWRQRLRDFTAPTPLGDHDPLGSRPRSAHGDQSVEFGSELTSRIETFAREHRVTVSTLFQAAWALLLSRYSGAHDVLFGATVSGRPPTLAGSESIVGCIINTVPVRVQVPEEGSVLLWLKSLQEEQNELRSHENIPLSQVRAWSEVPAPLPLFESLLIFENWPGVDVLAAFQGLRFDPLVRTIYPLTVCVMPRDSRLLLYIEHDLGRFDGAAICRMLAHLEQLLRSMIDRSDQSVAVLRASLPAHATFRGGRATREAAPRPRREYAPPRTSAEETLAAICGQLLRVERVSIAENFFELGGDSLLAARLFARIREFTGRELPLATLFQAPTVEQLAALLTQEGWSPPWSSLVAIQPNGSKPPFFCVHGHYGNVVGFRDLARHLGEDQPFYGLQAQGLDGKPPSYSTMEEMAAHYLQEVRSRQPNGPYYLGGHCFGGHVAFEMAQQLRTQGEPVALLALLDIEAPTDRKQRPAVRALRWHLENLQALDAGGKWRYVRVRARNKLRRSPDEAYRRAREAALPQVVRGLAPRHTAMSRAYSPRVYPGRVTLFRISRERAIFSPDYGWGRWAAGGVDVHEVPGDNETLLHEPHVRALASRLSACLEHAREQAAHLIEACPERTQPEYITRRR